MKKREPHLQETPQIPAPIPPFVLEMDHMRWHELACRLSMAFSAYKETVIKEIEIQQLR